MGASGNARAARPPTMGRFRTAAGLLSNRQSFMIVLLTMGRTAVGFCDLLVAVSMYLLFLLLQGHSGAHQHWWAPRTGLTAAVIASVFVVLRALMDLFSSRSVFRLIQSLHSGFILRLTEGYSLLQWEMFIKCNRSELSGHALYAARDAADFYHRCIEITANVAIFAAMIVALICQSPMAACGLSLVLGMFYGGHRLFIRKRLQDAASDRETSLRALQRNIADALSSGKEIRTYGNHRFFQERIRQQAEHVAQSTLRVWFLPQFTRIMADQGAVLVFLLFVVAVQFREGDVRQLLSLLVFYFVISRRLLPLISQISFLAGEMEGSFENVKTVDSELTKCRIHRMPLLPALLPDEGWVMQMEQVSFSFQDSLPILRDVNLSIREGEAIVIRGASGIGKSSLLNLIAGVSQSAIGTVRIDRRSVAYVPQEVPLLDDSIRNNLLFGLTKKTDGELMQALAAAMLDEFVAAQPYGLDTRIGDNGALFSGGQRQRLGLARANLRRSRLLLLDEATSALDENNERQVLENLTASGQAILIVTHRAKTQMFAHRVFHLEEGSLIEEAAYGPPVPKTDFSNECEGILA